MAKKRSKKSYSQAAKKGWETRRTRNPLVWGKKAIAKKQEKRSEIQELKDYFEELFTKGMAYVRAQTELEEKKQELWNLEHFGESHPSDWKKKLFNTWNEFVMVHDENQSQTGIAEAHRVFYEWKEKAREELSHKQFENIMNALGSVIGLSPEGSFSIQSFITS